MALPYYSLESYQSMIYRTVKKVGHREARWYNRSGTPQRHFESQRRQNTEAQMLRIRPKLDIHLQGRSLPYRWMAPAIVLEEFGERSWAVVTRKRGHPFP